MTLDSAHHHRRPLPPGPPTNLSLAADTIGLAAASVPQATLNLTQSAPEDVGPAVGGSGPPAEDRIARTPGRRLGDGPCAQGPRRPGMISIRRISLGGGYRYLIDSVAAGDGAAGHSNSLARYSSQSGTTPGVFMGRGLADLDGGRGVEVGSQVAESHLENMLVALADPISGEPLGSGPTSRPGTVPVAGFDLTFSPSKSVSVAWALADEGTKAVIYEC